MTFSEKVGYKVGNLVLTFRNWSIPLSIKAILVLGALSLLAYLFYLFFKIGLFVILGIPFILFYFPSKSHTDNSYDDNNDEYQDGYRDGHSGFGFYYGDVLINENSEEIDANNTWGN
ncbi:hypothetical protein [Conservatibacter flavescens]|uniref:DUF3742 domain-containing protein n=1 Tax=Conservatibacter flavescens TaxID=28161 RepID=A0A2M8S106_9PAST|nr:hypothetical protein [Conservatibacter flavescens]PJG84815.1 hypothetical protein CVP05_09770 [Conservatibacter flavescens]